MSLTDIKYIGEKREKEVKKKIKDDLIVGNEITDKLTYRQLAELYLDKNGKEIKNAVLQLDGLHEYIADIDLSNKQKMMFFIRQYGTTKECVSYPKDRTITSGKRLDKYKITQKDIDEIVFDPLNILLMSTIKNIKQHSSVRNLFEDFVFVEPKSSQIEQEKAPKTIKFTTQNDNIHRVNLEYFYDSKQILQIDSQKPTDNVRVVEGESNIPIMIEDDEQNMGIMVAPRIEE